MTAHPFADAVRHHDLDAAVVTDPAERRFRTWARWWSPPAVLIFIGVAVRYGLPGDHDYVPWQSTASLIGLAVAVAGLVLALRWEAFGGGVALVGGVAVGALAAVEYHPLLALGAAVVFVVPGVLYLLAWHRTQTLRSILVLALVIGVVMLAGGAMAWGFYDHALGETHPASRVPAPAASPVVWVWSGGVTDHAAVVVAKVAEPGDVALQVGTAGRPAALAPPSRVEGEVYRFELTDLEPATPYDYALVVGGAVDDEHRGRFVTFPSGAASFTVAVGSCSRMGSNGAVYDAIAAEQPDLYVATGDFYYGEIIANDVGEFADAFDLTLTQPGQAALYAQVPIAYVWDDHDYGPNDAGADSPSRQAALQAYRRFVPHYSLGMDGAEAPIAQAFTVGRVRFVMTDLRSARVGGVDTPTMLGSEQLRWLLDELAAAAADHALVVWVSTVPWIAADEPGADHWGGYVEERRTIADHIAQLDIDLLMLAGDAHMVAIDSGANSDYSGGDDGFVVMHAAALDRPGSDKGGPFSEGTYPGGGQYGLVSFVDDGGDQIVVTLDGRTWNGTELVSFEVTYDVEPER